MPERKGTKVIEHDFGGNARKAVRRFTQLLTLDALHEANIRENPVPYLERASERIYQLERLIFEALQTCYPVAPAHESVSVDKAEYQALLRCRAMLEKANAGFDSQEQ
ncbi:MAG: hypothetical protein ACLQUZ_10420 [Rhizomicrobium sp.]